ncbi:MAG: RlmE family RNA methyltransferase [Rhodospirillales bacterium]|nr:RlmE family RNA methyltransferase [Rhodospirillales bacterium]
MTSNRGHSKARPGRGKNVRVKSAKGRKISSTLWLQRQLNDPYVELAAREGYRSRAAYKLIEMDDRFHILRRGCKVVDLGAAPGGWTQVIVERTGAENRSTGSRVVAVDITEMDPIPGATILKVDFLDESSEDAIRAEIGDSADLVLSDMAPAMSGHTQTDHLRIMGMAETAYDFARQILGPGGIFIAKVLQGGTEGALLSLMKVDFETVRHVKPPASRTESKEIFVVAMGFRGEK